MTKIKKKLKEITFLAFDSAQQINTDAKTKSCSSLNKQTINFSWENRHLNFPLREILQKSKKP